MFLNKILFLVSKQKIPTHQTNFTQNATSKDENDNSTPVIELKKEPYPSDNASQLFPENNEKCSHSTQNNIPILEVNSNADPLNEANLPTFRGLSLEEFEFQRQLMEDQNKQKREMLQKAISK